MLSEEEIKAMMGRAYPGCGDFEALGKGDITFVRAIERAVLERAAAVCKEMMRTNGSEEYIDGVGDCHDAIRALLPKEES